MDVLEDGRVPRARRSLAQEWENIVCKDVSIKSVGDGKGGEGKLLRVENKMQQSSIFTNRYGAEGERTKNVGG